MFKMEFAAALDGARDLTLVEEIARVFWRAYGAGEISDSDAASVSAQIEEARRRIKPKEARAPGVRLGAVSMFRARRRRCVSPDRAASLARRRRLAYSGPMPPALAAGFTVGKLAALRIVADEVRKRGWCELSLGEIAARAGVGVTTARDGINLAAGDGLLRVTERRRHGAPSLPNVIRIMSREWKAWIAHTPRGRGGGSKIANPKDKIDDSPAENLKLAPSDRTLSAHPFGCDGASCIALHKFYAAAQQSSNSSVWQRVPDRSPSVHELLATKNTGKRSL